MKYYETKKEAVPAVAPSKQEEGRPDKTGQQVTLREEEGKSSV